MIIVPIAALTLITLTIIFSGLIVFNLMIGNYALAFGCCAIICVLGIILGFFVGKLGTALDGRSDRDHLPSRLDLSEDVLKNLLDVPEGVDTNATVPPMFDINLFYESPVVNNPAPLAVVSENTRSVTGKENHELVDDVQDDDDLPDWNDEVIVPPATCENGSPKNEDNESQDGTVEDGAVTDAHADGTTE